jgi:hypothetical protein
VKAVGTFSLFLLFQGKYDQSGVATEVEGLLDVVFVELRSLFANI